LIDRKTKIEIKREKCRYKSIYIYIQREAHLSLSRYCNAQYCRVYGMKTGGRKGVAYCALVLQ